MNGGRPQVDTFSPAERQPILGAAVTQPSALFTIVEIPAGFQKFGKHDINFQKKETGEGNPATDALQSGVNTNKKLS